MLSQKETLGKKERQDVSLCQITFTLSAEKDTIIPPFSSKLPRTVMIRNAEKLDLKSIRLVFSSKRKPIRITPIFKGNKPLIKIKKRTPNYVTLFANEEYYFSISGIGDEVVKDLISLAKEIKNEIVLYNSKISIWTKEIHLTKLSNLGLDDVKVFGIRIITPTLLQLPSPWKLKKPRHFLFPLPSLVIKSLADHWNLFAPLSLKVLNMPSMLWRTNYLIAEVDHNIKPITVIYDEDKEIRGFVGSVIYELRAKRNTSIYKYTQRLFDYANYFGIGRSRAIGFGVCKVSKVA